MDISVDALEKLLAGIDTVVGKESLVERLAQKKILKVKLGVDPTRPDLTFGHMVVFNKLRQFQDLGHEAILLIGDHTATIGDPSGRSAMRPVLTAEEVERNAQTYLEQAFKVIDPERTTLRRNSEWFRKMSFDDMLVIARKMTVARMLERDDFAKRYREEEPISIVEFLYPLMQGYDSVMLGADVELGGTDQFFNLLVGRALQKDYGQPEQIVITMPLLVGLDGKRKMSKSYDNYISFNHSPRDMFGRIMSITDDAMWTYFKLLLEYADGELEALRERHPMEAKKSLAKSLVERFFGGTVAGEELAYFESVFSDREVPEHMSEFPLEAIGAGPVALVDALHHTQFWGSRNEIRRLIEQGAVKINGKIEEDFKFCLQSDRCPYVIQAGKKIFFRII
ncbi:MAG: tyrosine--tRNA ligase [Puniceicoccales bacterium]|jgi:tyrosyl-tRNA synthetase|nr:tyrosine--tRNA ligase [Puniceicoccales bacterium]